MHNARHRIVSTIFNYVELSRGINSANYATLPSRCRANALSQSFRIDKNNNNDPIKESYPTAHKSLPINTYPLHSFALTFL